MLVKFFICIQHQKMTNFIKKFLNTYEGKKCTKGLIPVSNFKLTNIKQGNFLKTQ